MELDGNGEECSGSGDEWPLRVISRWVALGVERGVFGRVAAGVVVCLFP